MSARPVLHGCAATVMSRSLHPAANPTASVSLLTCRKVINTNGDMRSVCSKDQHALSLNLHGRTCWWLHVTLEFDASICELHLTKDHTLIMTGLFENSAD